MPLCAHNCGGGALCDAYWGLHASECISEHGRKNVFLVVVIRGTSLWIWASRGPSATEHSLLVFHCLISVAAHTTCCRNVNFLILFWWYSTLIYSFDAKLSYAAGLPISPLLQGHFLWEILPQRQTNKSKKENQKKEKKTATILITTAKENKKYVLFVSI